MRNSHISKGSVPFYIFWTILLLLSIIITVVVISSIFPHFRFSFAKLRNAGTDSESNAMQLNSDTEESPGSEDIVQSSPLDSENPDIIWHDENSQNIEEDVQKLPSDTDFTDISDNMHNDNNGKKQKSSLFAQSQFTLSPKFLSLNGKHFLAGSLEVVRQFPRDFQDSDFFIEFIEKYSFDTSIPVHIVVDIGWDGLLSFTDIDKILATASQRSLLPPIEIPSLEILNIRVSIPKNFLSENSHTTDAIASFVKKSIRTFFNAHDFTDILSESQQALAVAYVSHGYKDIVLFSLEKE